MDPICLSLVPILRCVSLNRLQSVVLLVPPGIEACFCLVLIFSKRNSYDMKYRLLAAEGLTYFLWTVLDFLMHIIPAARSTLHIFKILDIILGSLTFAPLLLYTSFIFLVARSELLQTIPLRLQAVTKYTILILIPMILIANALGSFVGISYRNLSQDHRPLLAVGFLDNKAQFLWTFFTNLALVLLTSYQALAFLLFLCRAVNVLSYQKRDEAMGQELHNHMFRGIVYMVLGAKFGAIETAVGFAEGGFGHTLARRILRLLGRALLVIGFLKGWDSLQNFQHTLNGAYRGPRGIILVPNPQYSTFRHDEGGDPESTMFQHPRTFFIRTNSPSPPYPNIGVRPRVTVHFPRGRAPTLQIRLSDISPISGDLEEPPKTAPARIYESSKEIHPSPYTPLQFSNHLPTTKQRNALTVVKDMMAKARTQYHRYSHSATFHGTTHLTSPSTTAAEYMSSAGGSRLSHSQRSDKTISWIGPPLSRFNSDNHSCHIQKPAPASLGRTRLYETGTESQKFSMSAAPVRSVPLYTRTSNKSMAARVDSWEDESETVVTSGSFWNPTRGSDSSSSGGCDRVEGPYAI